MNVLNELLCACFLKRRVLIVFASLFLLNVCAHAQTINLGEAGRVTEKTAAAGITTTENVATDNNTMTEELVSVRALMRMEMAMVLAHARQQSARLEQTKKASGGMASRLELPLSKVRLTALYGTGSKLVAEVQAGTRTLTYINGKALPVGVTSGETVYRLVGMKGRCLTLVRQGKSQHVCMDADAGETP
ncbi:hypothetical protein [Neopusillimonas maritima]|jgi:hypothetical protein|uniref:Type IV pilus biogenesis protein PilP n=1 Tax=Neopusillimonas maritima TaxID=2026239 RepID=A0ABX9MSP8_9BURK|nr:hypothetical protein [Neopusillimonas maritima]RII81970.1 hypothetical protein CJO09_13255 [Neopusillimonas maritima]